MWKNNIDDQALAHAKTMLGRKDQSLQSVVAVLEGECLETMHVRS